MARLVLPGFRFHPTGVELLKYYLKRKVLGKKFPVDAIAEIDIYKHAPWDLPDLSLLENGDLKWFFFCPLEKKYPKGARLNRAALHGHWKATGRDKPVFYNKQVVGRIKTLVFHQGKSPKGDRTDWLMHEYRLEDKELADKGVVQDTYVLCVVYKKDGTGSKNGAQYGAPFKEEDYMSDIGEDDNVVGAGAGEGAGSGSVLPEQDEPSAQPGGLAPLADPVPVPDTNAAAVPVSNANALMEPEPPDQLADQVQDQFLKEDDAAAFMTYNNSGQMSNGKANDFAFEAPPYQVSEDDDISWTLATFKQFCNNGYYPVDYLF